MALNIQAHSHLFVQKNDTIVKDTIPTSVPKDTIPASVPRDTTAVDSLKAKKAEKPEKKKEETEYEKLMKKGGHVQEGLFRTRHIDDKYYFEVPDSMLGRLILSVTRFTAVPQSFGKFAGEEIDHSAVYFEARDTSQLLLRQYVLSHLADTGDNISRTLEQSTVDPIVMAFKVIGRDSLGDNRLVEVTGLFRGDNNLTSIPSAGKTAMKLGGLQNDRTFIDTIKWSAHAPTARSPQRRPPRGPGR